MGKNAYIILIILWILVPLLMVLTSSCEKEKIEKKEVFSGKNYFPLKKGSFIIYEVTEINIDAPSNYYDTVNYFLKEYVEDTFTDAQGDVAYRIERYHKTDPDKDWKILNVWSSKIVDNMAQKTEENLRFVKIRFPVKNDLSWNGNLFNEKDEKKYRITELNIPKNINNQQFDSCLTVTHDNSLSLISKDLAYEVYAYNIGLVYKENTTIRSQEVIFDIPIEERITTGTIYIRQIVDYHIEY